MNLEPQKFFIGLMDFFSVLLPGALLTYLLTAEAGPSLVDTAYPPLKGAAGWAAFLFSSYLCGHFVFLLGSLLDEFYDWIKQYNLNTQIPLVARWRRLLPRTARALARLVFKHERNVALDCAKRIKQQALAPLQANDAINTFQWCKALLTIQSPESMVLVQRFEADSKFFRSFVIVLLLLAVTWPLNGWTYPQWRWEGIGVVLVLLVLALWRYMEQRLKSTNLAYWSVITLTAQASNGAVERLEFANSNGATEKPDSPKDVTLGCP